MEKGGKKTSNETRFQKMGYERVDCETTNLQVNKLTNSNGKQSNFHNYSGYLKL